MNNFNKKTLISSILTNFNLIIYNNTVEWKIIIMLLIIKQNHSVITSPTKKNYKKSCKTIIENFRQCASNRNGNMLDVYRQ